MPRGGKRGSGRRGGLRGESCASPAALSPGVFVEAAPLPIGACLPRRGGGAGGPAPALISLRALALAAARPAQRCPPHKEQASPHVCQLCSRSEASGAGSPPKSSAWRARRRAEAPPPRPSELVQAPPPPHRPEGVEGSHKAGGGQQLLALRNFHTASALLCRPQPRGRHGRGVVPAVSPTRARARAPPLTPARQLPPDAAASVRRGQAVLCPPARGQVPGPAAGGHRGSSRPSHSLVRPPPPCGAPRARAPRLSPPAQSCT